MKHLAILKEAIVLQRIESKRFDPDESRAHCIDRCWQRAWGGVAHVDAHEGEDSNSDSFEEVEDSDGADTDAET